MAPPLLDYFCVFFNKILEISVKICIGMHPHRYDLRQKVSNRPTLLSFTVIRLFIYSHQTIYLQSSDYLYAVIRPDYLFTVIRFIDWHLRTIEEFKRPRIFFAWNCHFRLDIELVFCLNFLCLELITQITHSADAWMFSLFAQTRGSKQEQKMSRK